METQENPAYNETSANAFEFRCNKCTESFNVHISEFVKSSSIICPNCKEKLPEEFALQLQNVSTVLQNVLQNSESSGDFCVPISNLNFSFRIKCQTFDY